jgi:hypothetical protein
MQHTLTFTPAGSSEVESNPIFNVLIAYEDFETGKHAKETYDFLHEHLRRECTLTNQMWKFDVLSIPKLREIAVRDASTADIIIISSHGEALPDHVRKWIESWLMGGTHALALVALFERTNDSMATPFSIRSYLVDVARRGGMEFFAQPDEWPGHNRLDGSISLPTAVLNERTLSTLAGAVHREFPMPRWGINE